MKMSIVRIVVLMWLAISVSAKALAQEDADPAAADERDVSLANWQFRVELRLPEKREGPYLALPIAPEIFAKAQPDLRDLRLTDAAGKRVPYALREMKPRTERVTMHIQREFDTGPSLKSRSFQKCIELRDVPAPGHNEIEIDTTPGEYRRRVEVAGANNDKFEDAVQLLPAKSVLVHYNVDGRVVDRRVFHYDYKQFRFLRIRIFIDATAEEEIPEIREVRVRRSITLPGQAVTENAMLGSQQYVRGDGGPGTAWFVELNEKMPCDKVSFEVSGPPVERPFRWEIAEPNQPPIPIGISEWRWRKDGERQFLDVYFNETQAKRFRFVVTDFANQPLRLNGVQVTRWVRQLVFEEIQGKDFAIPLRLFVGNKNVGSANYDIARKLPIDIKPAPAVVEYADRLVQNPAYQPPPPTIQERMPWLVHVVLGFACVVLCLILGALAKQAIARHDAENNPIRTNSQAGSL